MCRQFVVFVSCLLFSLSTQAADLMTGKQRTQQDIDLDIVVAASPRTIYAMWTTAAGVKTFLAPKATIGRRPGEEYTIYFAPDKDPLAVSHGTGGARILKMQPARSFAFEWITFAGDADLGVNGPPVAPRSLRDLRPLPTWVALEFQPLNGGRATHVVFRHYGFGSGALWDESRAWFERAWAGVLVRMKESAEAAGNSK